MEELDSNIGLQIERLVQAAASSEVLTEAAEPKGYYYLIGPDGKANKVLAERPWHAEELASPDELEKFIANRIQTAALGKDPAIFYGPASLSLCYDLTDRRDRAVCRLTPSPQYTELTKLSGQFMAQKDFIRTLRVKFRNALADTTLLNLLRNVQWQSNDGGQSNIQHGKESLGRTIVAQVQGVDVIPEEVALTIPVYDNHPFVSRVQCAIDINVEARSFALTPFPQELHRAVESTLDDILIGLTQDKFPPAFRGQA